VPDFVAHLAHVAGNAEPSAEMRFATFRRSLRSLARIGGRRRTAMQPDERFAFVRPSDRRMPQGVKYECESASIGAASLWRQSDDTVASRWSGAGRSGADGSRCYHAGARRRPGGVLAGHRVERDGDLQRCDLQSGSRHQATPKIQILHTVIVLCFRRGTPRRCSTLRSRRLEFFRNREL
jgi:hypothetical protein